ncbi:MAG: hypothetical protein K5787_09115 [Lentisphaeria bacterium]|nr:hypothetical protein [Lentisphaeria bacterium]
MKRLVSLLIVLCLLVCPLAKAWESAVHAKSVQDICKALGFSEEQAICVGDGAWFDGSDVRVVRKEGQKDLQCYRNQDRVFNTGVWGEGTPVKTYGKFTVSPNDTRYLNARKYLNRAISLAKEGSKDEAFFALGIGVRALQNIFANRDAANDATWTRQAKMVNGASTWVPGMTFDAAWHNVNPEDNAFSKAHSEALKAALRATADYVGEFLAACPKAVGNVKRLPPSAIDGIVNETVSLLPARAELTQKVQKSGREIMNQIDKALATFPAPKTAADIEKLPPRALTLGPANRLVTLAKLAFKQQLKLVKSDVDDFAGSAGDEWKTLAKTTEDSLVELRKSADGVSKALAEASAAWKKASPEDGYAVARRQLVELSKAVFTLIKPYLKDEQFFDEQIVYWLDVLQEQMKEYTLRHEIELAGIYHTLKTQLPKTETAFSDFMTSSNAAVKEYTGRCENALADFNEEMAAIATTYGKDADGLKQSAAERVSAVSTVFDEKAKQAVESLKAIAPLKQGDEIPKAVEDVIRNLMKDASELRENAFLNIAPKLSFNRCEEDIDPQKIRGLLAAHAFRQDFLQPIEIGSTLPDSWVPAVWKSDDELEITLVRRIFHLPRLDLDDVSEESIKKVYKVWDTGSKANDLAMDTVVTKDYAERISDHGFTENVAKDLMGDVIGGKGATLVTGLILDKTLGLAGKVIGTAIFKNTGAGLVGEFLGHSAADAINHYIGPDIAKAFSTITDFVLGEGASDVCARNMLETLTYAEKGVNWVDDKVTSGLNWANDKINSGVESVKEGVNALKDGAGALYDMVAGLFGDDTEGDMMNKVDQVQEGVQMILDHYDMDDKFQRTLALFEIDQLMDGLMGPFSGLMEMFTSFGLQIRGFMMNIMNFAVDIEHIDISSEMNQSLQMLTNDLNTMMGKDNEQDKDVKRKATIENKGRDLMRQSNPGRDLKGAPGVKQIQMN